MPAKQKDLTDEEVQELYAFVDQVPLSRPKRNFARDFSDGVLFAETIAYFYPRLVEVHNYSAANSFTQKMYNWSTLNKKVLRKLHMPMSQAEMEDVCNCVPMAVERQVLKLQQVVEQGEQQRSAPPSSASHRAPEMERVPMERAPMERAPPRSAQREVVPVAAPSPTRSGVRLAGDRFDLQREVDTEILVEKEQKIQDLRETVEILETKVKKLEQLLRLKDAKIVALSTKLEAVGGR